MQWEAEGISRQWEASWGSVISRDYLSGRELVGSRKHANGFLGSGEGGGDPGLILQRGETCISREFGAKTVWFTGNLWHLTFVLLKTQTLPYWD